MRAGGSQVRTGEFWVCADGFPNEMMFYGGIGLYHDDHHFK